MNSPELNNYIQYVTRSGIVKAKSVVFLDNGETTTFEVAGINEDFFIFGVFQNNLQRYGIGFENFDNINMLSFINSSIVDLACVPVYSFLSSEQVVTMSYNNEYVKNFQKTAFEFPQLQVVHVDNFPENVSFNFSQKSNELVFFEHFLSVNFPDKIFNIFPIHVDFSNNFNNGNMCIQYAKHSFSSQPVYVKYSPLSQIVSTSPDVYHLFSEMLSSSYVSVHGYMAECQSVIFGGGGGSL